MENVATYVRVSCHSNAEIAVRNQAKKVNDFCEEKGYTVADSVSVIGDRKLAYPMLMKLLESAKEKGIKKIVMVSTNRIVGTVPELQEIKKLFDEADVTIETMDGSYEYGLSTEMILASYASLAAKEFEMDEDESE